MDVDLLVVVPWSCCHTFGSFVIAILLSCHAWVSSVSQRSSRSHTGVIIPLSTLQRVVLVEAMACHTVQGYIMLET